MNASPTLREWLAEQPFTLTMSSGFFGFFAHTGLMTTLEDAALLPRSASGSSAGALVSGLWAAGLDAVSMRDELLSLRREDFWDPMPGLGLLRGELFRSRLEALVQEKRFDECRIPVTVSVFDVWTRTTRTITAGHVAAAVQASCTVPFLFHPRWVEGRPALDGGILDRPGLHGIPAGERVFFHHLASRSPWRRRGGASMQIPRRTNMTSLVIEDLPRVGPFRLPNGAIAFERARRASRIALDRPVRESLARLSALE
jgi:NTE family protein